MTDPLTDEDGVDGPWLAHMEATVLTDMLAALSAALGMDARVFLRNTNDGGRQPVAIDDPERTGCARYYIGLIEGVALAHGLSVRELLERRDLEVRS